MQITRWLREMLEKGRSIVTLAPFDTSTSEGRGRERYRRIALSSVASAAARFLNLGVSIAAVPLVLGTAGPVGFGVWATVASLILVLGFTDLGLGNGLLNAVAHARGNDDLVTLRGDISSAFFFLTGIAAILVAAFALAYDYIPWSSVLSGGSETFADDLAASAAVMVVGTLVGLPFSVVQHTQVGSQEGFRAHLWTGVGALITMVGLVVATAVDASIPWLVAPLVAGPLAAMIGNFVWSFILRHRELLPRLSLVSKEAVTRLSRLGLLFFVLQLAVAVGYQSDQLIIAHYLGPRSVAEYAVPFRLFFVAPTLLGLLLTPFWPAYREALARGDMPWVRRAVKRTFLIALAVNLPPTLFLLFAGGKISSLMSGGDVVPSTSLLVGMGLWAMMSSLSGPIAVLLNAGSYIGFQVVTSSIMAAANIVLSIYLVQQIGVAGPVFGSAVAQLLFILIPAFLFLRKKLSAPDVA